jgi:hypothetical protein
LLFEALVWLTVMRVAIVLCPFRWLVRGFRLAPGASAVVPGALDGARAGRIAWAIQLGAVHTPWLSTCLAQSLTGMAMLRRRGISGTLYLGVARRADAGDAIIAHSWLCCGDAMLTGAGQDMHYTPVASFSW